MDDVINRQVAGNFAHDDSAALNHSHFTVFEVDDLLGRIDKRSSVAAHKELVVSQTEQQRRTQAANDHLVGLVGAHHHNGIGTDHLVEGEAHSLLKINLLLVLNVLDEVHKDLGVGIAREGVAFPYQQLLELGVVLNDSVVHNNQSAGIRRMRVCVAVAWLAVGRPASVTDSEGRLGALRISYSLKGRNLAHFFINIQASVGESNSGGIVSAVL